MKRVIYIIAIIWVGIAVLSGSFCILGNPSNSTVRIEGWRKH